MIGERVAHKTYGSGVVVEYTGSHIAVEFAGGIKKFVFPDAFEKFLRADNSELHNRIIADIEQEKRTVEKKRQAELEAHQRAAEQRQRELTGRSASKAKSFDEMFSPDYHVEHLARHPILDYHQVEEQFGINISGFGRGINPTPSSVVLISSMRKTGGSFVYHDRWTSEGDYLYSGEGRSGDQSMSWGNLAIKNAARDGKKIHLFVKFSPQDYFYQGVFKLVDYTYEDEKDESGRLRKEFKFRLRKVTEQNA